MSEEEIINILSKGINMNESMINTISNYHDEDINKENLNDMMNICKRNTEIIQEIINYIEEKDKIINEAIKYIKDNLIIASILDGKTTYCLNSYSFDYEKFLEILERGKNGK